MSCCPVLEVSFPISNTEPKSNSKMDSLNKVNSTWAYLFSYQDICKFGSKHF